MYLSLRLFSLTQVYLMCRWFDIWHIYYGFASMYCCFNIFHLRLREFRFPWKPYSAVLPSHNVAFLSLILRSLCFLSTKAIFLLNPFFLPFTLLNEPFCSFLIVTLWAALLLPSRLWGLCTFWCTRTYLLLPRENTMHSHWSINLVLREYDFEVGYHRFSAMITKFLVATHALIVFAFFQSNSWLKPFFIYLSH